MSGISELLQRYGTSLEETRKLVPKLTEAVKQKKAIKPPTIPTAPQFFTPEEVRGMALVTETGEPFRLEPGWTLKVVPPVGGGEPRVSYISPTGWEQTEEGIWVDPEGNRHTPEQMQAEEEEYLRSIPTLPVERGLTPEQRVEEEAYREYQRQLKLEGIFGKVFPQEDVEAVLTGMAISEDMPVPERIRAEQAQEEFLTSLREVGRTEDTEAILQMMGAGEEYINELFATLSEFPTVGERRAILQAELGFNPAPPVKNYGERQERVATFQAYRKAGGKLYADQWELYGMPANPSEELPTLSPQERQVILDKEAEKGRNLINLLGEGLTKLPKQIAASVLQAIQGIGGASVVDRDWADEFIKEAHTDIEEFTAKLEANYGEWNLPISPTDLATLPQNMAFSITSMGAGLGAGLPVALLPVPGARVAAWLIGSGASGVVAYNITSYQIMQEYLELKNEEMIAATGRGLTATEEQGLKDGFEGQARAYGLWEAIPEAVSNLAFAKILTLPLGKVVGKNIATKIITKLTALYGQELLTETITQKGQSAIEVDAGLRAERISWVEAFKEIAPQTFLLTTVMGGIGQVGVSSVRKIRESLKKEAGESPSYDTIRDNITEDVFDKVETEAIKDVKEVPKAEAGMPEAGLQAGAFGVPAKEVRPLGKGIVTQAKMEDYLKLVKYNEAQTVNRISEIEGLLATKGRLPKGEGTKPELQIELARLGAERDVAEFPEQIDSLIKEVADELGNRSLPYHGAVSENKFPDRTTKQLDEMMRVYEKAKATLAKPVEALPEALKPTEEAPIEDEIHRQLGELAKMSEIWSKKLADREQTKVSLARYVRENLPPNVRGKYITSVARVKTDAQLQIQIARVQEFAELNAQKVLKVEIRKAIKKARPKIKDHILKGKFTPETQSRFDVLNHNLELDRDVARDKMAENSAAYQEGKLDYEQMLNDNEMLNFAGIDGMSAEELANTLEYIKILESIGRSDRQAKQEAEKSKIAAIRSDISNILTGGAGLKTGIGAVPTGELVAKTGWWDTFTNWQYGIDNLADKLSKLDPTSKPYQSVISQLVSKVHRATNRQVNGTKVAFNDVKRMVGEVYEVKGNRDINQTLNTLGEEVNLGVFEFTEAYKENHPGAATFELRMTRDQMIAKYMQVQDSTLDGAFDVGMGWSQKVKDAITNNLSAKEKALANSIFKFYEDYYTDISEVYRELYNIDMPKNSVYSPRFRDFEADVHESVLTLQDAQRFAGVTAQSIKARQQSRRPIKFNGATELLSNHIQQMEHFKAWATTMRDMRRVFGNKDIRLAIEQYHGRGVMKLIDTFLNQMAGGGIETAATNRAADFLRRNFTKSILAIKPVIMLKQIPSLFGYVSEMKTTEFVGGIADFWSNPVTNFRFLYNNSEMFRARMDAGFERDIRAAMQKHGKKLISGQGKLTDWFLLQIRLGDAFAVTQGMWAKYKAGLNQGLTQELAIQAAEDTTGRTQPSFGIDTLSAIQNSGSWLKLMTMFQNQPNKYFRMVSDNLRNYKYGRGSRAKAASTILLTWCILPMMFQYIADAFQWKPERQLRAGLLGPLNFILIGGQLVQSMWGWLTDQPFDYQISPVAQTGRDLQMIFLKAKKMIEQGLDPFEDISVDDMAALVEYLAKATGQVTGLPTPYFVQLSKLIRHKFEKGEELEIKDFLFSEWALKPPEKNAEEKVEDFNLKLGEIKEGQEDKPLTEKELQIYDTEDWLRDIGNVFDNVLPQDVLDDTKSSKESKAWAEYETARSKADILPNTSLHKINTEDNGDTIINYYQQWKAREKITSLEKLKEYDKLYPKAYLGNVTRQQYTLLVKYLEAEGKDAFLEEHPELKVNPRNEWLKANPADNALLVIGGQAKILTPEAYNEFNRLLKELDIPNNAIPEITLPPEGSVENYFKYNEMLEEFSANSWEVQLLLVQDNDLREFLGRQLVETPIRALELKIKGRELSDQYDALETDEDRAKLKADNPEWVADMRRIEAIEHGASDDVIEGWVERGKLVDEFSAGSSEVKLWLIDHPETFKWALDQELLTDDGSDWDERALRLNMEMQGLDEDSEQYKTLRYRRDAYQKDFPENLIDTYVEWYSGPALKKPTDWKYDLWYEDDWFLIEHPEFYKTMLGRKIWKPRELEKVPTRKVFELYKMWKDLPLGQGRREFEARHSDLDMWLHEKFGTMLESGRKG